jgi:hypothetical protein
LLTIAGKNVAVIPLDDDTRAAVQHGLTDAQGGEFASDDIVAKADKRRGL